MKPLARISIQAGCFVAIRTRQRDAHLVGRVVDGHQGIYLLQRHVRGTATFREALVEITVAGISDVVYADEDQPLSDAMERLWIIATAWFSSAAAPSAPRPLTHRIEREWPWVPDDLYGPDGQMVTA